MGKSKTKNTNNIIWSLITFGNYNIHKSFSQYRYKKKEELSDNLGRLSSSNDKNTLTMRSSLINDYVLYTEFNKFLEKCVYSIEFSVGAVALYHILT